jgi:hypothetical protein
MNEDEIQICGEIPKDVKIKFHEYPPTKFICTINASDESELRVYLKANDYLSAFQELEENLRNFDKHGFPAGVESRHDVMDKIRELFYKTVEDYDINLREGN